TLNNSGLIVLRDTLNCDGDFNNFGTISLPTNFIGKINVTSLGGFNNFGQIDGLAGGNLTVTGGTNAGTLNAAAGTIDATMNYVSGTVLKGASTVLMNGTLSGTTDSSVATLPIGS